MFQRLLIANRGEIARRIIRACRKLKIESLAVYTQLDARAIYVEEADESHQLGDDPRTDYLNVDLLLRLAREQEVDAIHPGYGFLSEDFTFAHRCEKEGIIFVGPHWQMLRKAGDKLRAKEMISRAGFPVIPGSLTTESGDDIIIKEAQRIGFPVMLKLRTGGGGIGLGVARCRHELRQRIKETRSRGERVFNSSQLLLEKYLPEVNHIEFQLAADKQQRVIHLLERDCSIQRRHQKIIEESPSPRMDPRLREEMGKRIVKTAEKIGYQNLGTVECLLDQEDNYYFLEINPRLQVEHPVTEMITGIDLVKLQLKLAAEGSGLPGQDQIKGKGHAIQCRIYAEHPKTYLPSPGKVERLVLPEGEGVRVECGIREGDELTPFFDPLVAKVITWGPNRKSSIELMSSSLQNFTVEGIKTNLPLLLDILQDPIFLEGRHNTNYLEERGAGND